MRAGDKGDVGLSPSEKGDAETEGRAGVTALGRNSWEGSPTSCLPPGSGLGGRASRAAASWVRKEEKSHILWWLYPLGSVPETLVTEQTVKPSGDRGRDRAAGAQRRAEAWGLGRSQRTDHGTCSGPLTCSFLRCFRRSLGWKGEQCELTHPGACTPTHGSPGPRRGESGPHTGPQTSQPRAAAQN